MTDRPTRDAGLDSVDRVARVLLGVGGCLSAGFFLVIAGGLILLTLFLLIGFAADPQRMAETAGTESLVIMGLVVALAVALLVAWWFALRGNRVALALLVPAGLLLALVTATTFFDFESGLDRGEDVQFLLFFIAALAAPLSMAIGAGLRLATSLLRSTRS